MIQEVKYNGFSASPSDYESVDGDLAAVVNMIYEDGALRPIAPPKVVFSLEAGQKVVLLHETSTYSHYIVQDASNKLYWRIESDSTLHSICSFGDTNINYITSVGNTIVALCGDGMHYMLWDADTISYKYLGNKIPECPISFGLQGAPVQYSTMTSNGTTNGKFTIEYESLGEATTGIEFSEDNKRIISSQVLAKVNKFIADVSTDDNKFIYPFFVRYAYRLYDNTLTHHSAPILMVPCSGTNPIVAGSIGTTSAELDIYAIAAQLDYRPLISAEDKNNILKWSDIVKEIEIYISAPLYTYDQSGECESIQDVILNTPRIFYGKCSSASSQYLDYSKYFSWDIYGLLSDASINLSAYREISLPSFTEADLNTKIKDCSAFYFLTSIEIKDLPVGTTERTIVPFEEGILPSLVARKAMTDDYQSNDTLIPSFAQTYNARLNIANIERGLFKGYDLASMVCYLDGYYSSPTYSTHVKYAGDSTLILERQASIPQTDFSRLFLYLYYPDIAAKEITIFTEENDGWYKTRKLEPHNHLNGAVFFEGLSLVETSGDVAFGWETGYVQPVVSENLSVSVPNKIYTSEVNNPFSFPLLGINTIGSGEIIGISTAAKALSEGQFGQFPLYAFTTDGVWALEVSATGSYSAKQPITRDVCLNGESITQIDDAVLFATARGIMLISGSESICITDIIDAEQPFLISQLPHSQDFVEGVASLSMDNVNYLPFRTFLAGCRMMYDYIKQRIFVFNPSCKYAYVYSLESKAWGIVASEITSSINSYPEPLAMDSNNRLVNMSLSEYVFDIPGLLVTRPLSLDARDALKTIDTIIQRGFFKKGDVKVALYGSRDLQSWFMVYSSTDHYLRGFRGTPYKFYRIAVSASLDLPNTITGCTTQYELRQINQPR